jgi:hypothetical protein
VDLVEVRELAGMDHLEELQRQQAVGVGEPEKVLKMQQGDKAGKG